MLSDIEIAQQAKMLKITEVAAKLGIPEEDIEMYGRYKAKLSMDLIRRMEAEKPGKLVLVTAITPTPAGEGKSTTTVGLAQGLAKIDKSVIVALREPSLGPCMGVKGGAAGGGGFGYLRSGGRQQRQRQVVRLYAAFFSGDLLLPELAVHPQ